MNSGSDPSFPDPPASGQKQFANGTDLPPTREKATWKIGSAVDVEWSIYANHGGGYSYRLCKKVQGKDATEECFQRTPLDFATDSTTIKYFDGSPNALSSAATYDWHGAIEDDLKQFVLRQMPRQVRLLLT